MATPAGRGAGQGHSEGPFSPKESRCLPGPWGNPGCSLCGCTALALLTPPPEPLSLEPGERGALPWCARRQAGECFQGAGAAHPYGGQLLVWLLGRVPSLPTLG